MDIKDESANVRTRSCDNMILYVDNLSKLIQACHHQYDLCEIHDKTWTCISHVGLHLKISAEK